MVVSDNLGPCAVASVDYGHTQRECTRLSLLHIRITDRPSWMAWHHRRWRLGAGLQHTGAQHNDIVLGRDLLHGGGRQ